MYCFLYSAVYHATRCVLFWIKHRLWWVLKPTMCQNFSILTGLFVFSYNKETKGFTVFKKSVKLFSWVVQSGSKCEIYANCHILEKILVYIWPSFGQSHFQSISTSIRYSIHHALFYTAFAFTNFYKLWKKLLLHWEIMYVHLFWDWSVDCELFEIQGYGGNTSGFVVANTADRHDRDWILHEP